MPRWQVIADYAIQHECIRNAADIIRAIPLRKLGDVRARWGSTLVRPLYGYGGWHTRATSKQIALDGARTGDQCKRPFEPGFEFAHNSWRSFAKLAPEFTFNSASIP